MEMHLFDLQISIWVTCFQAFDLTVSSCYYKEAWSSKLGRQLNSLPNQLKKSKMIEPSSSEEDEDEVPDSGMGHQAPKNLTVPNGKAARPG